MLLLSSFSLQAKEKTDILPSIAFLEYLANMKEVDGKLYGPQDMTIKRCQPTTEKREEKKNETSSNDHEGQKKNALVSDGSATDKECKYHEKTDTTELD